MLIVSGVSRPIFTLLYAPRQVIINCFEELAEEVAVERQLWIDRVAAFAAEDLAYRRLLEPSDSESLDSFGSDHSRYYYCGIEVDRNYLECNSD